LSEQVCRGTIPPQHEYRPCTNPVHATVHCGFRTLTGDECRAAPPAAHPPEGSQPHAHYPDPTDCDTCNDPPTVDKGEAEPPSPPPGPGQERGRFVGQCGCHCHGSSPDAEPCGKCEPDHAAGQDGRHLPTHAVMWLVVNGRVCRKQHAPTEQHEWELATFAPAPEGE
jgi:hypothetical protein